MEQSRRKFLAIASVAPILLLERRASAAPDAPCYNPATLPMGQKAARRGVEFVEVSSDPKKRCGLCAFFKASAGNCGTCQILLGGQVTTISVCNSFAPKG
jgi:hypothetical protein